MFLPINKTELSEDRSFLNGLLEVLDFNVGSTVKCLDRYLDKFWLSEKFYASFRKIVMKIRFRVKKTFGLDFVSQVRS